MEGSRIQIQEEILLAKQSRQEGNEGRARVCARRAAGAAARVFLVSKGFDTSDLNAILLLQELAQLDSVPPRVRQAVDRLLERVDENHNLPPEIDLIHEANIIISFAETRDEK
jgi:hypothetical protein